MIVAPATYNTINKCAQGISDTYALGVLAEAVSLPSPVGPEVDSPPGTSPLPWLR